MRRLAIFCHRRAGWVVAVWLAVLAGLTVGSALAGPEHQDTPTLPASDSSRAQELVGGQGGATERIVIAGPVEQSRPRVEAMLGEVAGLPGVVAVVSPYDAPAQVSGDIAYAAVRFGAPADSVDLDTARALVETAEAAGGDGLTVAVDGAVAARTIAPPSVHDSGLGLVAAAVVLLLAFGSLTAMLLPLVTAAVSVGSAVGVVGLLTHVTAVPTVSLEIVALLGLGVGVDYALFVVTRYRQELRAGAEPDEALGVAASTSGRGVLFAGVTVCVSLLGMLTVGIDFLDGIAYAASISVLTTMLAALTLLPALLRPFGRRLAPKARHRKHVPEGRGWSWVAQRATGAPGWSTVAALLIIGVLALPAAGMRLGVPDAGVHPEGSTTRVAYDLLAEGFGDGFAGPLVVVGEADAWALARVYEALSTRDDVAVAAPPVIEDGVGSILVQPEASPQDPATAELVRVLREEIIPASGAVLHVGGNTAVQADFSAAITDRLPLFLGTVVAISFVLLVIVFRSVLIPLTAAVMNLLAAAAMFGALTAVFQLGWFGSGPTGPIEPYIPVFLFAGLFGLSMDYEVFLVTRIQEEWRNGHDTVTATVRGLASTGRTITAAALIMALVFVSFVPAGDRVVQETGLGLTVAVLLDAVVIRAFLVPAVMAAFGRANWWLPGFVDRWLPRLDVEGRVPEEPLFDWFRPVGEHPGERTVRIRSAVGSR